MRTVNLYTREESNIFHEVLSCKGGVLRIQINIGKIIIARLEPETNLPVLNKTYTFSTNTFKNV